MHTVHAGFSFVCRVKPEGIGPAREVLDRLRARGERAFEDAPSTHFITSSVLPMQMRGDRELPPTLLFLTSYWGPTKVHLAELVQVIGDELRELFSHCVDPPGPNATASDLIWFMEKHRKPDTFYSGMHHVTRRDVLHEQRLRRAIDKFVDDHHDELSRLDAVQVRARIQEFVRSVPELEQHSQPWRMTLRDALVMHRHILVVGLILAAVFFTNLAAWRTESSALDVAAEAGRFGIGGVLVALVLLFFSMRYFEWRHDRKTAERQPDDEVKALENTQLNPVINEFTVAGPIKLGWLRPIWLRVALWIVARYVTTMRISIPTVAAARWLAIDGGRRLIFVSNFTNMAEGYVRDFIDTRGGAMRINLVFGWGLGYPQTFLSLGRGAKADSNGFIYVVNLQQRKTDFWFCPYKDISIDNIVRNRKLRQGLFDDRNWYETQEWLRLL